MTKSFVLILLILSLLSLCSLGIRVSRTKSNNIIFETIHYPLRGSDPHHRLIDKYNLFATIRFFEDGRVFLTGNSSHAIAPQSRDYRREVYHFQLDDQQIIEVVSFIHNSGFEKLPDQKEHRKNLMNTICDTFIHDNHKKTVCRPIGVSHHILDSIYQKITSYIPREDQYFTPASVFIQSRILKFIDDKTAHIESFPNYISPYFIGWTSEHVHDYWRYVNDHVTLKYRDESYIEFVMYVPELSVFDFRNEAQAYHAFPLVIFFFSAMVTTLLVCCCLSMCCIKKKKEIEPKWYEKERKLDSTDNLIYQSIPQQSYLETTEIFSPQPVYIDTSRTGIYYSTTE